MVVAKSNIEAEYKAIAQGIYELIWLEWLLSNLNISLQYPMKLYSDSKSTIAIFHNPIKYDRMKHVQIDRNFIKSKVDSGRINLTYMLTKL